MQCSFVICAAYQQAAHLSAFGTKILGVSCTCALATDRIKKGDHKVWSTFMGGLYCNFPVTLVQLIQSGAAIFIAKKKLIRGKLMPPGSGLSWHDLALACSHQLQDAVIFCQFYSSCVLLLKRV